MVLTSAPALIPATDAFLALVEVAARVQQLPDAEPALALVRRIAPLPRRRRPGGRPAVPAGAHVEVLPGPCSGSPLLAPAIDSFPGLDPARHGLRIYRALCEGRVEDRRIEEGARIFVSLRPAARGDWAVIADRRTIRIVPVGSRTPAALEEEGRFLGVVEGILSSQPRRRCG